MSIHLVSDTVLHTLSDDALLIDIDRIRGILEPRGALTVDETGTEQVDVTDDEDGLAGIYAGLTAEVARRRNTV